MDKNSVRYGIIAGLGAAIYSLVLYFISPEMIFGNFAHVTWLIYLFCMWKAASLDKEANGGYSSFRQGFSSAFIVFAIAGLIAMIFQYLLVTMIDPGLIDIQKEIAYEQFDKIASWAGMEEGSPEYEKALIDIEERSNPSVGQSALGYVFLLVIGAIPSLIIAAIVKKDKPLHIEAQETEEHLVDNA